MGIMNFVRKLSSRRNEKSEKFKEMLEQARLEKMVTDRDKSANERELERIIEKKRQDHIAEELNKIRKKENRDNWKGKNLFTGHKSILHEDKKVLTNDRPILKQKNIFSNQENLFSGKNNMFIDDKWNVSMSKNHNGSMFFK